MSGVKILRGLSEVVDRYDSIFCDIWGVLHNGAEGHARANDALLRFKSLNSPHPRRVILLSNAPRPSNSVRRILDAFGISREAYDDILTSGDLSRALIAARSSKALLHLGPERDLPIYDGLDVRLVALAEADRVVCTGLFDDRTETADDYRDVLLECRERDLQMLCANPDLAVERDGRLIPCAGAIAAAYVEMGGDVVYAGKPFAPIYDAAVQLLRDLDENALPDRARILAVGDSLSTDVAGARAAGIPSLLVARGIHAEELGFGTGDTGSCLDTGWLDGQAVRPDAIIEALAW